MVPPLAARGEYIASERTMYRPTYKPKGFETLDQARKWCKAFVKWYRFDNHHSGIKFLTPAQCHAGKGKQILQQCHKVYEAAKALHPERWHGRNTRDWSDIEVVWLNPDKVVENPSSGENREALAS